MKRLVVVGVCVLMMLVGCGKNAKEVVLKGFVQNNIISVGTTVSGKIVAMQKSQGEPVSKGDTLAVIDTTGYQYAVEQLTAIVSMKQAKLEELRAGTLPHQIEQAEGAVAAAKANLTQIENGSRPQQIAQAEANVKFYKAKLDEVKNGNRVQQIDQAKANVDNLASVLKAGQDNYAYLKDKYEKTKSLVAAGAASESDVTALANQVDNAKDMLGATESQKKSAEAALNLLKEGATEEAVTAASGSYEQAVAQLQLIKAGSTKEAIQSARANYEIAVAQLNLLKEGPTKYTLTTAEADLAQASAQLKQAQYILANCTIVAPSDGIVTSKNYELGDVVSLGANIEDIAIAKELYILTYVPAQYMDKISYNQTLTITTDAGECTGVVNYIDLNTAYTPKELQSKNASKNKAVKVKIKITDESGVLKSGMNASVHISL